MKNKSKRGNQVFSKEIASVKDFEKNVFTISEITRISNVTRRQLTCWEEEGIIKSTFKNFQSSDGKVLFYFSRTEVVKVLILGEMKNKGYTSHQIKKVARNLAGLQLNFEKSGTFVLSDGYSVYFAESEHEVIDIWKHNRQMILIPIEDQIEKLRKAA